MSPITYIGSLLQRDLLVASMNRSNDYSKETLFQCTYEHLSVYDRFVEKNVITLTTKNTAHSMFEEMRSCCAASG